MIECDALRLLEEFIKKSSNKSITPVTEATTRSNTPLSTINSNQSSISNSKLCRNTTSNLDFHFLKLTPNEHYTSDDSGVKSNDAEYSPASSSSSSKENHPTLANNNDSCMTSPAATPMSIDLELTRKNPNRPYSYYAATNFNPLDFSEFSKDLNKLETDGETSPPAHQCAEAIKKKSKRKSLFKTNSINLLSLSLTDLKASTNSLNKNKQVINTNPLTRKNKNSVKTYSYCDRDNKMALGENLDQKKAFSKSQNRLSMGIRFNNFIRNIFRLSDRHNLKEKRPHLREALKSKQAITSTGNRKDGDCDFNENDEVFESQQTTANNNNNFNRSSILSENLRFSRLFGSFRNTGTF